MDVCQCLGAGAAGCADRRPLHDEFGAKTYFLIGSDYAFGRGMLEFTRDYIEDNGGEVLGEEYLPMDGSDWTAIICN